MGTDPAKAGAADVKKARFVKDVSQPKETPETVTERQGPFYYRAEDGNKIGRANKLPKLTEMLATGCVEISQEEYQARKNGTYTAPQNDTPKQQEQPEVTNLGGGVFSIEGLMGEQPKKEEPQQDVIPPSVDSALPPVEPVKGVRIAPVRFPKGMFPPFRKLKYFKVVVTVLQEFRLHRYGKYHHLSSNATHLLLSHPFQGLHSYRWYSKPPERLRNDESSNIPLPLFPLEENSLDIKYLKRNSELKFILRAEILI